MREKENNMDLNEIRKIIREEKAKIMVVVEGEPSIIVMSYEDYKNLKGERKQEASPPVTKVPRELESETLKIDDLPF